MNIIISKKKKKKKKKKDFEINNWVIIEQVPIELIFDDNLMENETNKIW